MTSTPGLNPRLDPSERIAMTDPDAQSDLPAEVVSALHSTDPTPCLQALDRWGWSTAQGTI